jgi:transcriptional regulator with XRE-family HTH domain
MAGDRHRIEYLSDALTKLGWSQAGLASRVDVHPNTVSSWMTGRHEIPGSVLAYVLLAVRVKTLLD